jgi:hypothetical protein
LGLLPEVQEGDNYRETHTMNKAYKLSSLVGVTVIGMMASCATQRSDQGDGLLSVVTSPQSSEQALSDAFVKLGTRRGRLNADVLVHIVNSGRYTIYHRRRCLFELFRSYVPPGTSLATLAEMEGTRGWFTKDTIITASAYSALPFKKSHDGSVFMFKLPFLHPGYGAIYFEVSRGATKQEVLDILCGHTKRQSVRVRKVGFSEPAIR